MAVATGRGLSDAALKPCVESGVALAGVERPVVPDLRRLGGCPERIVMFGGERLEPHDLAIQGWLKIPHPLGQRTG